jgi:hypothetical protein
MESEQKSNQYYVLRGQDTEGPLTEETLFSMRRDGVISDETLVCRVGDSQWTPNDVLFPSAKQAAPQPPPPPATTLSVATIALPVSGQPSKEDRKGLHDYLVTAMRSRKESDGEPFFKDTLAKAFPALGILLGRELAAGKEDKRCEALFLLHKLLDLSATYLEAAPWVTYLAAKKHAHWTDRFEIATAAFVDFSNKKLVDEAARLAEALETKASAIMDSETSANIQELIRFQERKGRLAAVISILNEAITTPHRGLILKQLKGEEVTVSESFLAVPAPSKIQKIASGSFLGAGGAIITGLQLGRTFGEDASDIQNVVFIVGLILLVLGISCQGEANNQRKEKEKIEKDNNNKRNRIQAILALVNRLAESFVATVKPLLDELQIAVSLNDFERILSQLEAYGTWGREMECFYIKT